MLAVPVGLLASAILVVNNVRDLETDRRAGKRTLAVRLGRDGARGLYGGMLVGGVRHRADAVAVRRRGLDAVAAAAVAGDPARGAGRADRARAHRRPVAQRRARQDRACSSSRSACCSPPGCSRAEPMAELAVETVRLPLRAPLATAWGTLARARARARPAALRRRRLRARARRRRWSPTTACRSRPCCAALDAYAEVLARFGPEDDAAALLEACRAERPLPQALAAIDLALWDRAGRRAGRPVAALLGGDAAEPVAGQRARRRRGPRGRRAAAGEAAAAGFRCVKVKVGDRRRRRPARRGARRGRARTWRSAPTPTAPGARRARRSPTCARSRRSGSSCARSRCTASRRCARCARSRPCRSRSTRARPSRARRAPAPPTRSA